MTNSQPREVWRDACIRENRLLFICLRLFDVDSLPLLVRLALSDLYCTAVPPAKWGPLPDTMAFVVPFRLVLTPSLEASPMTTVPRPLSINERSSHSTCSKHCSNSNHPTRPQPSFLHSECLRTRPRAKDLSPRSDVPPGSRAESECRPEAPSQAISSDSPPEGHGRRHLAGNCRTRCMLSA
jgi:hypothetical protein